MHLATNSIKTHDDTAWFHVDLPSCIRLLLNLPTSNLSINSKFLLCSLKEKWNLFLLLKTGLFQRHVNPETGKRKHSLTLISFSWTRQIKHSLEIKWTIIFRSWKVKWLWKGRNSEGIAIPFRGLPLFLFLQFSNEWYLAVTGSPFE